MLFCARSEFAGVVTISVQQAEDYTLVKLYKTSDEVDSFVAIELFEEVLINCSDDLFDTDGFEAHYRVTLRKFVHPEGVKLLLRSKGFEISNLYGSYEDSQNA